MGQIRLRGIRTNQMSLKVTNKLLRVCMQEANGDGPGNKVAKRRRKADQTTDDQKPTFDPVQAHLASIRQFDEAFGRYSEKCENVLAKRRKDDHAVSRKRKKALVGAGGDLRRTHEPTLIRRNVDKEALYLRDLAKMLKKTKAKKVKR